MSVLLSSLEPLWELVSRCLKRLTNADAHAALALQPSAEAFFLVYGSELSSTDSNKLHEHPDAQKLLHFAGKLHLYACIYTYFIYQFLFEKLL